MDEVTAGLVDYAQVFSWEGLSGAARTATLNHVFDAVACAVAGSATEPAQIAARLAGTERGDEQAVVWGAGLTSTPAHAAFANTIMVRTLDWNDGMFAKAGGHPSDMVAPLVAIGEVVGASGRSVLEAVALAYEVLGALGNQGAASSTKRGWDQGLYMGVATALAIGKLRGMSRDQLANAVSLSIVPAVPLMVTRRGELSMWKGAATAAAVLHAIQATRWAEAGITGPAEPFAGGSGVFDQISGGPFELTLPAYPDRMIVEISHQKVYPAESHSQALIAVMPRVLEWAGAVEAIESIDIAAYLRLYVAIGSDPSVWDPKNRETADHSLPYLLARALVDGDVSVDSFTAARIADPTLRPVMAKIHITEDPRLTEEYRPAGMEVAGAPHTVLTVTRNDGAVFTEDVTYPRGHLMNPMTAADLDAKLDRASIGILKESRREEIRRAWWALESAPRVADVVATLARFD
jgi:2-methylcitrate dehydratase